jgi:DNA-binding NtrC family response regulator
MDTILLVYAHDFLRRYLAEILESEGYRAVQAGHTDAAVQFLNAEVRLILCEDQIAGDMLEEARKQGIPVLVTTTRLNIDMDAMSAMDGIFLEMPFRVDKLLSRISTALMENKRGPAVDD